MEADRSLWEGKGDSHDGSSSGVEGSSVTEDGSPDRGSSHVALGRAVVTGATMDLGILRHSNSVHISIAGEGASVDDLRLMYRCRHPSGFTYFSPKCKSLKSLAAGITAAPWMLPQLSFFQYVCLSH